MSSFVPILVGCRYSRGKNRNRFGSVVSLFSLLGMAIGVAALILVLSVMNGFNGEISGRLQTLAPHLTILPVSDAANAQIMGDFLAQQDSDVIATSPVLESFVMLSNDSLQRPMKMIGIDPAQDSKVVSLSEQLVNGRFDLMQPGEFGIILGSYAANSLMIRPGDTMNVILPRLRMTPAGLFPRQKSFRVIGVFDSGSQLDADYAYVHIQDAAKVLGQTQEQYGWRVRLADVARAEETAMVVREASSSLGDGWVTKTWSGDYQSLFSAMRMEKITVGALLMIIVLVAAFNIVSGLIMMVSDKRSDMAVLRTMGASSSTVVRIFIVQGLILGVTGILFGAFFGTFLALYLSDIVGWFEQVLGGSLFDPTVFYVSFLPSEWRVEDFFWVLLLSLLLTIIATILPAIQAAKISPREALNYKQ